MTLSKAAEWSLFTYSLVSIVCRVNTNNHQQKTNCFPLHLTTSGRWTCPTNRVWHDDVIKWKYFPRYWPFVRGIHQSPVNSPHKGQWHGALMFSMICAWISGWVNTRKAANLRRHCSHYDVIVMHVSHALIIILITIIIVIVVIIIVILLSSLSLELPSELLSLLDQNKRTFQYHMSIWKNKKFNLMKHCHRGWFGADHTEYRLSSISMLLFYCITTFTFPQILYNYHISFNLNSDYQVIMCYAERINSFSLFHYK